MDALIRKIDMRFDIMGHLPFELVILVWRHLDISEAYRCRRVSPKWFELLSAEVVLNALLATWRMSGDLRLKVPPGTTPKQTLDLIAEHQNAFRCGIPFSRLHMTTTHDAMMRGLCFSYCEGYLAWLDLLVFKATIVVHHLESGKRSYRVTSRSEYLRSVAISSTLLVVVSYSAKCYIWAHQSDKDPCMIDLPSVPVSPIQVTADSVVMLLQDDSDCSTKDRRRSIITIRCTVDEEKLLSSGDSNQPVHVSTHQFLLPLPDYVALPHITVDRTGQHVIVVYRLGYHYHSGVHLIQFDYLGNVEFKGFIQDLPNRAFGDYTFNVKESFGAKSESVFNIWSLSRVTTKDNKNSDRNSALRSFGYSHVVYSPSQRKMEIQTQKIVDLKASLLFSGSLFLWKGVLFSNGDAKHAGQRVNEMHVFDIEGDKGRIFDLQPGRCSASCQVNQLHGDETFLVRQGLSNIDVWCFDKYLQMAGADPDHKGKLKDPSYLDTPAS